MDMSTRRYYIEVRHTGLGKYRVVSAADPRIARRMAELQATEWDTLWARIQAKKRQVAEKRSQAESKAQEAERKKAEKAAALQQAVDRTQEAQDAIAASQNILAHTLTIDDAIDWDSLKDNRQFEKPQPKQPAIPRGPQASDEAYRPRAGLLGKISTTHKATKEAEAKALFERDHAAWTKQRDELLRRYEELLSTWEKERAAFFAEAKANNDLVEQRRDQYLAKDPAAIMDYCTMVLNNSQYSDWLTPAFEVDYQPDTKTLIVDYQLPALETLPRVKEVKYVQSRDEYKETCLTEAEANQLYDSVLYQIVVRTTHELFEADKADALTAIVLNGWVHSVNKGTGQDEDACILSLHTTKAAFTAINLARVDPKQTFRSLKGVGSPKLHSLTPVAPIMELNREDRRFIQSHEVISKLEEGENLATMPWEEFEHLIRELFEREFAQNGSEVRVTQASRDGGVDAVVFDPDPIRGGKIVIQAKRYTRTVGVSAVRDLYGTVMNEGATKGILVTTSEYGPDAHEFAKGKPLALLTGANLLHLLTKHGYKGRIDLQEARKLEGRE
jgi:restriction system protein